MCSFFSLNFYAFAQRNMARDIVVLSCASVRASVCAPQNIVNMISCRVFDTYSPNLRHYGTEMNAHNLGSKVKVTVK